MEIANYGRTTEPIVDYNKTQTLEFTVDAADGNRYGIIRENSQYTLQVEGDDGYTYLNGMKNNKKYKFNSYSEALKKLNLMMKPLNEMYNSGNQFNLIGEQETEKKYVIAQPEDEESSFDEGGEEDMGFDEEGEGDMGFDEEGEEEISFDEEGDEGEEEISFDEEGEDDGDAKKSVQKLTGKLGQKLRDMSETEIDADIIKYVLNSIISAVPLDKLTDDDKDEIVEKFEDDEIDYTEEGEFDVEMSGEEDMDFEGSDDMDADVEDFDIEGDDFEEDLEESLKEPQSLDETVLNEWGAVAKGLASYAGAKVIDSQFNEEDVDDDETLVSDIELTDEQIEELKAKRGELSEDSGNEEGENYKRNVKDLEDDIDHDEEFYEESPLNFSGEYDDQNAISAINDIFESTNKVSKTLSSYFEPTKGEIRKHKKLKKDFLNETIRKAKYNKNLKNSFSTYEQEKSTTIFLKENNEFRFIGKNKRGGVVFKHNKDLVEVTSKGRII